MKAKLVDAMANMREDEAYELAQQMIDAGDDPMDVLDAGRGAMSIIGDRYESGEYFLPELIIAGEMLQNVGDIVEPHLKTGADIGEPKAKVVLGTIEGDIHDIGKDIVAFMMDLADYEIHDLGVDVSAATFVAKIQEVNADIVGMSGFLTMAFDQMKLTVEAIEEAGLRDDVKIIIGGAPMDDDAAVYIGADAFGQDATAAVRICDSWIGEN